MRRAIEGVVVAGSVGEGTVAGDTAAAFGRTAQDADTLYVVTSGSPKTPALTEGGKVVAVDTSRV